MRSLRGLVLCEDPDLRSRIHELLLEGGEVHPALVLQRFPEPLEAARHLHRCRPEVVLVATERLQDMVGFLQAVEAGAPGVPVIGISRLQDPRALGELMRLGVRDCVAAPLNRVKFLEAIHRIAYQHKEALDLTSTHPIVCFLPSRGGSGTSTLACNVSFRMASLPGAEVLLADLDACAGVSRLVFKLALTSSLRELAESGHAVDSRSWLRCVVPAERLHVIQGGLNPRQSFTPGQMRQLVDFAAKHYNSICVDLTGGMETYTLELLRRSCRILLVSKTEADSLELAREKLELLASLDLHSRTRVLLTVSEHAAAPHVGQLQTYLGTPIDAVFSFHEKRVMQSLAEGSLIDAKTTLGRTIEQFSKHLKEQLQAC